MKERRKRSDKDAHSLLRKPQCTAISTALSVISLDPLSHWSLLPITPLDVAVQAKGWARRGGSPVWPQGPVLLR